MGTGQALGLLTTGGTPALGKNPAHSLN